MDMNHTWIHCLGNVFNIFSWFCIIFGWIVWADAVSNFLLVVGQCTYVPWLIDLRQHLLHFYMDLHHTVELQWLKHLLNLENMFETGVVRANEC